MNFVLCVFVLVLCEFTFGTVDIFQTENTDKNVHRVPDDPIFINVTWSVIDYDLHTIPTIQVVTNPLLSRQFSPVHKEIFASLAQLNAEYTRYAVWFPYPKMAVAELDPPSGLYQCRNVGQNFSVDLSCLEGGGVISKVDFASYGTAAGPCGDMKQGTCHAANSSDIVERACIGKQECSIPVTDDLFGDPCSNISKRLLVQIECDPPQNNTYWNFTYLDPILEDFFVATDGHKRIISYSTQPSWLFALDTPHVYPDNATKVDWPYAGGTSFVDETLQQLGDYYGRLVAWYTCGGFIDEYGREHLSNYKYNWDYIEIFNEVDNEHHMDPQLYTQAYDAVIQGIRRHTNNTEFKYVGLALAGAGRMTFYSYFLNHSNHAPDIPLDMISYHRYSIPKLRTDPLAWEIIFSQIDDFVSTVEKIEVIRKALSPKTRTTIDELGVILPDDNSIDAPQFPLVYWNAAAAQYAYAWTKLSRQGIDIVGQSQLVGYPYLPNLQLEPQFPSVALLNWTTGAGTARYWTSKLIIDTVQIDSDQAVITQTSDVTNLNIFTQAFVGKNGRRWVILINKRFANIDVSLPNCIGGTMQLVNEASGFGPAIQTELTSSTITLTPYAVAVVHMPSSHTMV